VRYFITGMNVASGREGDDVSQEAPYFELGWEVVTTHLDVKRLKREGIIEPTLDTIVTCTGREFLYTAEFPHVVDYPRFLERRESTDECIDCTKRYAGPAFPVDWFEGDCHTRSSCYKHRDVDLRSITNVSRVCIAHLHGGRSYGCLLVRRRDHAAHRNMTDETARFLLDRLCEKYERVFLVGHGAETFARPPHVVHVDLVTYASLIQDERCETIIGSFTGTMQLAALLSKAKTCLVVNDALYDVEATNHPITLGRCIRLSASNFFFIPPTALSLFFDLCAL
jgi:hypothetical protein